MVSLDGGLSLCTSLFLILIPSFGESQRVLQTTFGNTKTYEYGYTVDSPRFKNDFGHYESKRLDGVVRGQYHVLLPDGRVQLVVYYADKTGYHPTITYLSLNDWNLIKNGRLALPRLRNRLRQNLPFDPRAQDAVNNQNGLGNLLPNSRLRNGLSTTSPFVSPQGSRRPFDGGNNGLPRRQPASLLRNTPSTRSPFVPSQPSRFSGRGTTIGPSTRFPTRTPFLNRIPTTTSTIGQSFNSQNGRPFITTRGSLRNNNAGNDSIFGGGIDGRGNSRFRPSTTRPFRGNVVVRNRNKPSDSTPVYFDNKV